MMRKRHVKLLSIVDAEGELRDIELERVKLERQYEIKRKVVGDVLSAKMEERIVADTKRDNPWLAEPPTEPTS